MPKKCPFGPSNGYWVLVRNSYYLFMPFPRRCESSQTWQDIMVGSHGKPSCWIHSVAAVPTSSTAWHCISTI